MLDRCRHSFDLRYLEDYQAWSGDLRDIGCLVGELIRVAWLQDGYQGVLNDDRKGHKT